MAFTPHTIGTKLASMTLEAAGFVVQRFHEGAKLDLAGFEENRRVRQQLGGAGPYKMLSILPEDIDFELSVLGTDHFGAAAEIAGLSALAVVANGQLIQGVSAIFFKYFPPQFPARIFNNEKDARAWLDAQP